MLYESAFFKSPDGGKTWFTLPRPTIFSSVLVDGKGAVWTGGYGPRVSRSVDGGISFADLSGNLPAVTYLRALRSSTLR